MDIYQHFRKEEEPFIDQVISWRSQVTNRYEVKLTDFLHPREQHIFENVIGNDETLQLHFYGLWDNAERKRAVLAQYYEQIEDKDFEVVVLQAKFNEKFIKMEHRDVLGAFLSAGIKRDKLGDLVIQNGVIQILVCKDISTYLMANVTSIKRANLEFTEVSAQHKLTSQNDWSTFHTTCSSLRLDVLIKEMYNISRQLASDSIKKGHVKVNHQLIDQPAYLIEANDMISVRGKGRTRLDSFDGRSKKDKLKITYSKLL
ncbi:RNA-binding protein [Gracilibacillus marinus]|jgi:RNA-binding protein YlmH|uniref:RNA-binding protein n=1 Tax=Gracilibacillus marinus TaxID=630535 RepID=A0ABV8VTI0_9BACI